MTEFPNRAERVLIWVMQIAVTLAAVMFLVLALLTLRVAGQVSDCLHEVDVDPAPSVTGCPFDDPADCGG